MRDATSDRPIDAAEPTNVPRREETEIIHTIARPSSSFYGSGAR